MSTAKGSGARDGRATVALGHGPHDRQAQSTAAGIARPSLVEAGEALEDPLAVTGGDAGPVVVHHQHRSRPPVAHLETDLHA
jgi:hypothetical protein